MTKAVRRAVPLTPEEMKIKRQETREEWDVREREREREHQELRKQQTEAGRKITEAYWVEQRAIWATAEIERQKELARSQEILDRRKATWEAGREERERIKAQQKEEERVAREIQHVEDNLSVRGLVVKERQSLQHEIKVSSYVELSSQQKFVVDVVFNKSAAGLDKQACMFGWTPTSCFVFIIKTDELFEIRPLLSGGYTMATGHLSIDQKKYAVEHWQKAKELRDRAAAQDGRVRRRLVREDREVHKLTFKELGEKHGGVTAERARQMYARSVREHRHT